MSLTPELERWRDQIREIAGSYGLDFFEVVFELLDWGEINVVASYGGFPNRYPHWRFGMEYEHLSKSYRYGLHRIYEMVINNDPCYAYLLSANATVDQKMVMAHVYAHSDFFKNNLYFASTPRRMIDEMGNHRAKVQRYVNRFGIEAVESFIDKCLSLENLIDIHRPHPERLSSAGPPPGEDSLGGQAGRGDRVPARPERDILLFLIHAAPLENWQKDVLELLREEAYYFAPQAATKILNEGWAAYWHSRIMTEKVLRDEELIDYASHHAATVSPQPGKLNPYKLGMELLRDVERRCDQKKIFEIRKLCSDLTFLDGYLTEEFCREQKLFLYGFNQANGTYEIIDRDFVKIKAKLLMSLANLGNPLTEVIDGNYTGKGDLCLKHLHEGIDLRLDWAKETLKNLHAVWKKPVHLETIVEGIPKLLTFDGEDHREQRLT